MTVCSQETHEAIKADEHRWLTETVPVAKNDGYQDVDDDCYITMRNCRCGSTIGRLVRKQRAA